MHVYILIEKEMDISDDKMADWKLSRDGPYH